MWPLLLLLFIWIHYIGDFVLQNDSMALYKKSSMKWLAIHCLTYTSLFSIFFLMFPIIPTIQFIAVTGLSHFLIDFVTSKMSGYFWAKDKIHFFFEVIGFDQSVHITVFILTASLFLI
jgi:hypothetical protein